MTTAQNFPCFGIHTKYKQQETYSINKNSKRTYRAKVMTKHGNSKILEFLPGKQTRKLMQISVQNTRGLGKRELFTEG